MRALALLMACCTTGLAAAQPAADPPLWDPASRTTPTTCDRLASGRYERERLSKPVARADIDVPAAIRQCESDLERLPEDPRILFQLGRLYGYTPDAAKARQYRERAAAVGNASAIFLLGYLDFNQAGDPAARCDAARRMQLAADRGNYSAQLTVTAYWLDGRFAGCGPTPSAEILRAYLRGARGAVDGFFETLLVDHLQRELDARFPTGSDRSR
jgi:TPR repeat protein